MLLKQKDRGAYDHCSHETIVTSTTKEGAGCKEGQLVSVETRPALQLACAAEDASSANIRPKSAVQFQYIQICLCVLCLYRQTDRHVLAHAKSGLRSLSKLQDCSSIFHQIISAFSKSSIGAHM